MKRYFPLVLSIIFISAASIASLQLLINPQTAQAAPKLQTPLTESISYTNISTIHLKGNNNIINNQGQQVPLNFDNDFIDSNTWDTNYNYTYTKDGCTSSITLPNIAGQRNYGSPTAVVDLEVSDPLNLKQCDRYIYQVPTSSPITNTDAGGTMFYWSASDRITSVIDNVILGQNVSRPTFFQGSTTKDLIKAGGGATCAVKITLSSDKTSGDNEIDCTPQIAQGAQTQTVHHTNVLIAGSPSSPLNGPPGSGDNGSGQGQTNDSKINQPKCDFKIFNPLTWLICPLFAAAVSATDQFDKAIINLLTIKTDVYFNTSDPTSTGAALYHAWSNIRTISMGILVIVGLVMVIAQAMGIAIMDAYTVKKVLPRLLIAVIAISLSWQIMVAGVNISNGLGNGVRALISAPFSGFSTIHIQQGTSAVGDLLAVGAILGLGVLGILSFAVAALLAVVIGLGTLIFREVLILALVITAPLAFACYILPNTRKVWDFWKDGYLGALLAFPIITGMIALGRVFAAITYQDKNAGLLGQIIAIVAYFGPYFLLPVAFKLAGGIFARVGGMVNNRQRGPFASLKKFRQSQPAQRLEKARSGNLYKGKGGFTTKLNRGLQSATLLPSAGLNPMQMRARMNTARAENTFSQARTLMEKSAAFQTISQDDDLLHAMREGRSSADIEQIIRSRSPNRFTQPGAMAQAVATVQRAQREGGFDAGRAAATMQLAATGTGYGSSGNMLDAINNASGEDTIMAGRMLGAMRSSAMQSGRADLGGGGFVDMNTAMGNLRTGKITVAQATEAANNSALDSMGGGNIVSGKTQTIKQLAPQMRNRIETAYKAFDAAAKQDPNGQQAQDAQANLDRVVAEVAGRYDAMAQISPNNARAMQEEVMSRNDLINITDPATNKPVTVQQFIESRRTSSAFQEMRREFATSGLAAANAQQAALQAGPNNPGGGPVPPIGPNSPMH
ncbi:MAG: hypothetical protein NVSMB46_09540 [Candidatus Saccharimonadales bacterium]